MTASLQTPTDIVNDALRRIGWKMRIGNLYDGSEAAKIALDIYGQTRDQLISDGNFEFEERNIAMTLLKQAPVGGYIPPNVWNPSFPAIPWLFSYAYPDDCVKVRAVKPAPIFVLNFDPKPHRYSVDNDNGFTPSKRVILCNVPSALLVYAGQITDPTAFDVAFTEAFSAALGQRLAPALLGLNNARLAAADAQAQKQTADMTQE